VNDGWPDELIVRSLTTADAEQIVQWRYEGPWKVYDSRPGDGLMSDNPAYLAVAGDHDGPLVGFCCAGVEARVPGLSEQDDILDVGVGMNPVWVGQGHGAEFASTVLDHYRKTAGAGRLRGVVQAWNERSVRLMQSLGFTEVGEHACEQGGQQVVYKVLILG
jgi:[ribosomal protein S18]-alanine N-acetyltransferase